MELLLELRVAGGATDVRFDCRADVDPGATVADLRHALRDHAVARRTAVSRDAVLWSDAGRELDDDHLVAAAPLRSGDRVWLGTAPPPPFPSPSSPGHTGAAPEPTGTSDRPPPPRGLPAPPDPPTGRLRRGTRGFRAATAAYLADVDAKVVEIERHLEAERAARHRALPPLGQRLELPSPPGPPTREPADPGGQSPGWQGLAVRIGTRDEPAGLEVPIAPGGDAELRRLAEERLRAASAVVADVPVAVDLSTDAVTGLFGATEVVHGVARSIVAQVALRCRPDEIVLGALVTPGSLRSFEWMRWLPHVRSAASPLPGESLAVWPDAVEELLRSILEAAEPGPSAPPLVVVVDAQAVGGRDGGSRLLDAAGTGGLRLIWLGSDVADAPGQCGTTVHLGGDGARSTVASPGSPPRPFAAEPLDVPAADRLARGLAPAATRPRRLGVGEMLGGTPVPAEVATAWSLSDGGFLDAPIGSVAGGAVSVDLAGSLAHAVVDGETVADRSDLLRSWVATLAARHPPERVRFLFVDGGSGEVVAPFRSLPHRRTADDDVESTVRAELDQRADELRRRGADDLAAWAAADPAGCPPRLVVVVHEAPGLAARLAPLVASSGRLGVHLVVGGACPDLVGAVRIEVARGRATITDDSRDAVPFVPVWSAAPRPAARAGRVRVTALGFGRNPDEPPGRAEGSQLEDLLGSVQLAFERSGRSAR